jgi:DNA-binding MarR family transcriptional regulator
VEHDAQPDDLPAELPDDLATLWYLVRRTAALMDREGDALCRRELGISLAQFLVLSVVDAYPGHLSQQAVADRLGLTKGTVSRQIDAAAAAGLMTVQVAAHTRREHAVALTEAGTALVRKGDALMEESRAAMLRAVPPDRLGAAIAALTALNATLS